MLTQDEKEEVREVLVDVFGEGANMRIPIEKTTPTIQADKGNLSYHCPECDEKMELLSGSIGECPQCQTVL